MNRPHSPDAGDAGGDRKRRRKVLSCYDCRRRKLQCDRAMPACGRCVKSGQAENCLYLDDPRDVSPSRLDGEGAKTIGGSSLGYIGSAAGASSADDVVHKFEFQERRIKQLEAALFEADKKLQFAEPLVRARAVSKFPLTPESNAGAVSGHMHSAEYGSQVNDRETMSLRGGAFRTQFLGSTHPSGLIAHLTDLNSFTKEAFDLYPALKKVRADMKALENRLNSITTFPILSTDADLKGMLGQRKQVDAHVKIFFDSYGDVYNVIHAPSFWREYHAMWADLGKARSNFVAVVLLMTAATECLNNEEAIVYTATSSTARDRAVNSIVACENWLRTQSQKHVTATDFQIRFLILLSKQVSARKVKRAWTEAGEFLRFCMSAGLHRSPDLIRQETTALDRELRRRIWAAATEFELQASFDRGMVPHNWPIQSDTSAPGNYNDDQLDGSAARVVSPRPILELTSSSYSVVAGESLALRHFLTTSLNNIRQPLSFEDVKKFTDELQSHIDGIPHWTQANGKVPMAKLSLLLHQYLLVLHDRNIRQAETSSERAFSRMILLETATKIINTHRSLLDQGLHALQLLCQDQVRAALSICHVCASVDPKSSVVMNRVVEEHAIKLMEDSIDMLADKTTRFGREQRQLWTALAAYAWWKAKREPARRTQFMGEAVDRIAQPYYKMMACQQDRSLLDAPVHENTPRRDFPGAILEYTPARSAGHDSAPMSTEMSAAMVHDPTLLDLDEIAAWTFDDWNFTPADFQQAFGVVA